MDCQCGYDEMQLAEAGVKQAQESIVFLDRIGEKKAELGKVLADYVRLLAASRAMTRWIDETHPACRVPGKATAERLIGELLD